MSLLTSTRSRARVVVGVDFGTTFSGFAFAQTSEPEVVHKFYEWPDLLKAGGLNYCKTVTALLYESRKIGGSTIYKLQDWGYSALLKHAQGLKYRLPHDLLRATANQLSRLSVDKGSVGTGVSHFVTLFKLHLVGGEPGCISASDLPEGLTPRRVLSDYLRKLSLLIVQSLQRKMGDHITMEDVQWCLTVPAIWNDKSKQEMKICASMAGMIRGFECPSSLHDSASPHPLIIVLEPEAASLYCQLKVQFPLNSGDKFIVVDVGGGTVDLVLHEKIGIGSGLQVREVSPSSGGLFGGSYVDKAFFDFLGRKISCFHAFARTNPDTVLKLKGWWETIKHIFDKDMLCAYDLELPARLARAWEEEETSNNRHSSLRGHSFDIIELSLADMRGFFDPIVDGILGLIRSKMTEALDVKAMMIVGGFSGSPYLVKRIRQEFSARVETIVVPDEPGAAICCGAVSYGVLGPDVIISRISKKTYGVGTSRRFNPSSDPPHLKFRDGYGETLCSQVFKVYTRKNDEVPLNHRVSHRLYPIQRNQSEMSIRLYSTVDTNPKYVCDTGVTEEGSFTVSFPSHNELGKKPKVSVSLYFGRTVIEVEAEGENFGSGEKFKMPVPVRFQKSFE